MARFATFALATLLLSALAPAPASAWGERGHHLASEAATHAAPAPLPAFFHCSYPRLVYMGYDPDRWRSSGPALHAINPPNHFLDLEYVDHLELPNDRYDYLELLTGSGTLRRFDIDSTKPGFLPWKVAEMYDLLTVQWRLWRDAVRYDDEVAVEQTEANIIAIAGEMGHYVADAANPHHSTWHYNGWVDPQPGQFECTGSGESIRCVALDPLPYDCETHSRFESQFVSRTMTLDQVLPHLRPAEVRDDPFAAAMALLEESNALVPEIYAIDREEGFDGNGNERSRTFAASRIAAGASLLRDLWYSSWLESAERPRRR